MGIPSLHAIVRAVSHLEETNTRDQISIIASGGLLVPGHFLKMLGWERMRFMLAQLCYSPFPIVNH